MRWSPPNSHETATAAQAAPGGTGRRGGTITLTFCMDMGFSWRRAAHEIDAAPLD